MTQTIRIKRCKTRREWAIKKVETAPLRADEDWTKFAARIVMNEHVRAVRIAKARDKWLLGGGYDNMSPDFQAGYRQACHHILAALTKGRA